MSIKGHDSGTGTAFPPVGDWNLPAANFISTDVTGMLPVITYPRPDIETSI